VTLPPEPRAVVVGMDGSEASQRAVEFATAEAQQRDVPLRILHARTSPSGGIADLSTEPDDAGSVVHEGGTKAILRAAGDRAAESLGADRVSWSIVDENPVVALRTASEDAQLLVVGSRGVGGVAGLLLGSTANGVVAHAACPVVVLPDETSVIVRERTSVVVGVEGRAGDEDVLAFAFAEAASRRADLVAVHAWQDATLEAAFQSLEPLVDWADVASDEERALSEALAGWKDKEPDVRVREVVVRERTARALVAVGLTAELLVVGHRHRRAFARLGATTHGVLHRAGCPVAVVPITIEESR
jgi:nucleotide-binding universal stress UspA family protein